MAYDVGQTCKLVNIGLTRSECASWIQAWGPIVAICAAIAVAWWQRYDERSRVAAKERLAAIAVSESAAVLLEPIQGCFSMIKRELAGDETRGVRPNVDRHFGALPSSLPMPMEIDAQILRAIVSDATAKALRTGPRLVQQAATAFALLPVPGTFDYSPDPGRVAALRKLVGNAIAVFSLIEADMATIAIETAPTK